MFLFVLPFSTCLYLIVRFYIQCPDIANFYANIMVVTATINTEEMNKFFTISASEVGTGADGARTAVGAVPLVGVGAVGVVPVGDPMLGMSTVVGTSEPDGPIVLMSDGTRVTLGPVVTGVPPTGGDVVGVTGTVGAIGVATTGATVTSAAVATLYAVTSPAVLAKMIRAPFKD
jgi:hypothetical protein